MREFGVGDLKLFGAFGSMLLTITYFVVDFTEAIVYSVSNSKHIMKTENIQNVGKHAFEVAGLGLAPFRFVGASENVITYQDGTQKAGGSCDYCGTGIRTECWVKSSDGKQFKVGCNCIEKVGDKGLLQAYKNSPEYRAHQRELKAARDKVVFDQLKSLIESNREKLAAMPHPYGFTDRKTGQPLTYLDQVNWYMSNCGASGRSGLLKGIKTKLGAQ